MEAYDYGLFCKFTAKGETIMEQYERLNKMLREHEDKLREAQKNNCNDMDYIADLYQSIEEIKGILLEIAEIEGFDTAFEFY